MVVNGAIGDQYGLPLEMMPRESILRIFLEGVQYHTASHIVADKPYTYSDDTQMTLSLLHFMSDNQAWTTEGMMEYWLRYFEPSRGYSTATYKLFTGIMSGELRVDVPEKRVTNGGLMRVSPLVKFAMTGDTDEQLLRKIEVAHFPTHVEDETCWTSLVFIWCLQFMGTEPRLDYTTVMNFLNSTKQRTPARHRGLHRVFGFLTDESLDEESVLDAVIGLDGVLAVEALGAALCCVRFHVQGDIACMVQKAIAYGGDCDRRLSVASSDRCRASPSVIKR
jgi:ADP-ribosylglycohydrolase